MCLMAARRGKKFEPLVLSTIWNLGKVNTSPAYARVSRGACEKVTKEKHLGKL